MWSLQSMILHAGSIQIKICLRISYRMFFMHRISYRIICNGLFNVYVMFMFMNEILVKGLFNDINIS